MIFIDEMDKIMDKNINKMRRKILKYNEFLSFFIFLFVAYFYELININLIKNLNYKIFLYFFDIYIQHNII